MFIFYDYFVNIKLFNCFLKKKLFLYIIGIIYYIFLAIFVL